MKLYSAQGTCSLTANILLQETKLPFELIKVDIKAHKTESGVDYYSINPKGYVPYLEIAPGDYLSEGPVIAQYIADQAGREDLMPKAGTRKRYAVMEWQAYVSSELHKSYSPLFNPNFDEATKKLFLAALRKKYEWVSGQLKGKQYLTGDNFTAADAYLFVVTRWSKAVGLDVSDLGELQAFMQRVSDRPAVKEALAAYGPKS
jgi:glutathione S-transferase